jgi:hypothetical protein
LSVLSLLAKNKDYYFELLDSLTVPIAEKIFRDTVNNMTNVSKTPCGCNNPIVKNSLANCSSCIVVLILLQLWIVMKMVLTMTTYSGRNICVVSSKLQYHMIVQHNVINTCDCYYYTLHDMKMT